MDKETFIRNYLERISYSGGREPNLKNLAILQKEHIKAIPFENTYVLKKIPIVLTKEWIYEKVIVKGRGGFCFELNYLFYLLLVDLGYDVKFLGGSVFHPVSGDPGHNNEHVLSLVCLDGKSYIVDVAFGGRCASEPLPLVYNEELEDPNGIFRYLMIDECVRFECKPKSIIDIDTQEEVQQASDTWRGLYRFKLNPINIEDTKSAYDFHTTSAMSPFTGGFYLFRLTDIGKTTFTGNVLTVYSSKGNMKEISKRNEVAEADFDSELSLHFSLSKLD